MEDGWFLYERNTTSTKDKGSKQRIHNESKSTKFKKKSPLLIMLMMMIKNLDTVSIVSK